jgi:hypothetical protein
MTPVTFRVCTNPLDAERAFWHAATGTPYEPEYREQDWRSDKYAVSPFYLRAPRSWRYGDWDSR